MRWILAMLLSAGIASAQDLRGPTLAAASNFGQGVPRGLMQAAIAAGITDFRDAVYWDLVEGEDGRFRYGPARTRYPDRIGQLGTGMSLTVNNGHALYEDGATPLGAEAIAAFGRHAAQVATRFPAIHSIEIGNEFNSANFVSGPLRDQGLAARARAYAALHDSVARQVRAARPDVRIIGAGVHSIPTGYLTLLSDTGIFARMDALAFHPYDTPVTLLDRQVALMRQVPGLAAMPLEITEFGTTEMDAAPGHLMRMMCKAALSGVTRLAWYPLHPRGDGFAPLLTRAGDQTPAGRAYALAQRRLTGQPVADVSPDAATPACLFGPDVTMVWGLPRALTLPAGVTATDALGTPLTTPLILSETEPLLLTGPLDLSAALAPQDVLADSLFHFAYDDSGPFRRLTRTPQGEAPLTVRPGQDRPGVPWTPYLGTASNPGLRLLPRTLLPSGGTDWPEEILHRYQVDRTTQAELSLTLSPAARSLDGMTLTVTLNGIPIFDWNGKERLQQTLTLTLPAGATLDIATGPGATSQGDVASYRFTLRRVR